ncbi:MAG TPA: Gfo/Idh/MocA family oxidoreductase [Polyangiaceae bacterium]|jgi:predicted dehydrogenase|nr:Gfo/Idh/MocA family oxidoreductase [Polyangiaceae bacterium]
MARVRIAFIGTGRWATLQHLPVIRVLKEHLELVCLYGRNADRVGALAQEYGVPGYSNLDQMFDKHQVDMVCAIVSCRANHEIVSQVAERGYSCVLETPIEFDLKKAYAMFDLVRRHKVKLEISENGFRMPGERLVKKLLDAGLFGKVLVAYNDVRAHGYHGISMLRNYIGFDVAPVSVTGHHLGVASSDANGDERILKTRFGIIEFANRSVGLHAMGSDFPFNAAPVRKRFLAEKGWMAESQGVYGEAKQPREFRLHRVGKEINGVDVCQRMVASTDPEIVWENPLAHLPLDDLKLSVAQVIMSMARAVREGVEQEYSLHNAYVDYAIDSAMCSSNVNGRRIAFPLDLEQIGAERALEKY